MGCKFVAKTMLGSPGEGTVSELCLVSHAVCSREIGTRGKALCGASPGFDRQGWGDYEDDEVTCRKCLEILNAAPVLKIVRTIEDHSEMHLVKYELMENDELCGQWLIRTNHQDYYGLLLSWGIYFKEEYRRCSCFTGCNYSEYLISEVATKHEAGNTIYVKTSRLGDEKGLSKELFERMATAGYVKLV
jgi:hypothetical protein